MKFENKRAIVTIDAVEINREQNDRKIYKIIQEYKATYNTAKQNNDQRAMKSAQDQISHYRKRLRWLSQKTYHMIIFVKKYRIKVSHAANYSIYNHSQENFKKFIDESINDAIRLSRLKLKIIPQPVRIGTISASKVGKVFTEEGMFLKAHVRKNIKNLYEGKIPTTQKKYIGIELEFCAPIKEEQLALKIFQKGMHKFVQLKEDGSLRPKDKENAFELAILLEESSYKKNLKNVTNLLTEIKAVAKDRRCGLHIHFDMRQRDKDLVYNNLVACQYALLSIVDPSRYNNEFCAVVSTRKFPTEFRGDRHERYKTINAAAYYKYKTLEIRMHEGSVSYDEISHWVDLLMKVVNYSRKLKNDVTELAILKKRLKLKDKLFNYTLDRSCTWQVQNSDLTRRLREDIEEIRGSGRNRNRSQPHRGNIDIEAGPAPVLRSPYPEPTRPIFPPRNEETYTMPGTAPSGAILTTNIDSLLTWSIPAPAMSVEENRELRETRATLYREFVNSMSESEPGENSIDNNNEISENGN